MKYLFLFFTLLCLTTSAFAQSSTQEPKRAIEPPASGLLNPFGQAKQSNGLTKQQIQASLAGWDTSRDLVSVLDGGRIEAMAIDGDNLYIGGDFHYLNNIECFHIACYNRKTDRITPLGSGFSASVHTLAFHKGKLYAGGNFYYAGAGDTSVYSGIAVWDGTVWHSMDGGFNNSINALAFVGDDLYAAGNFSTQGSQSIKGLAKWDGTQWLDPGVGIARNIYALRAVGDSLFIGGDFVLNDIHGIALFYNNTLSSIGGGVAGGINSIGYKDNMLWLGGNFIVTWNDSLVVNNIATYDANGWHAIGEGSTTGVNGIIVDIYLSPYSDSVIVSGEFTTIGGTPANSIAIFANGKWQAQGTGIYGVANVARPFNGSIIVGGKYSTAGDNTYHSLSQITPTGWVQLGLGQGTYDGYNELSINAIAANDQYVFLGGSFLFVNGQPYNFIAAWNKTSKQWEQLGTGLNGEALALSLTGDNLYVGGWFQTADGIPARCIACWHISEKRWEALGDGAQETVSALLADSEGVYASTTYEFTHEAAFRQVHKWIHSSWQPVGGKFTGYPRAFAKYNNNLYVGGMYWSDNTFTNYIAMLDGDTWAPLNGGLNNVPWTLLPANGNLYVGGAFTTADGQPCNYIARWDGTNWSKIGNGFNSDVYGLAEHNGDVYAAGNFTKSGTSTANFVAKWDGVYWRSLLGGTDGTVMCGASDKDNLYLGGYFSHVNNKFSYRFARYAFAVDEVKYTPSTSTLALSLTANPVLDHTSVQFTLAKSSLVQVTIENVLGEQVASSISQSMQQGKQELPISIAGLAPGSYYLHLRTATDQATVKFIVQ